MSATDVVFLLLAGFAASAVNALAGGGSLVTFPTLVALGLPPVAANVTNSLGVSPGYVASVVGSRRDLADLARWQGRRALLALLPTSVTGTAAGCALLLVTPGRAFEVVVPFLILGATAALAFQHRIRALVGRPRDRTAEQGTSRAVPRSLGARHSTEQGTRRYPQQRALALHALVFLGSAYGGYFGAALGVMLVAGLALVLDESLRYVSALKNAISAVAGLVTVVVFAAFGPVDWVAVAVLVPATLAGGYLGARLLMRLPPKYLHATIVTVGTIVGIVLLVRAL
jgi:hypothetical protein